MISIQKLAFVALVFVAVGCNTTGSAKPKGSWVCSAKGLQNYSYSGGSHANIHLRGYSRGGNYKVILNKSKTVARGVTGDSTPFRCIKK